MSKTLLKYQISPDKVYISTQATLTLTIENPLGGKDVVFREGRNEDEIDITFPAPPNQSGKDALTDSIDFQGRMLTKGFSVSRARSGGYFAIFPTGVQTLKPGNSIQVSFPSINVNAQTGAPVVKIQEYIGANEGETQLSLTKLPHELSIVAWGYPQVIGQGQSSTLFWTSFGGTSVEITGFAGGTGVKNFPVSGEPPYPGKMTVNVPLGEPQRNYTLTITTNDGQHRKVQVTLTQHSPIIDHFGPVSKVDEPIRVDKEIGLTWESLFGYRATLQTPASSQQNRVSTNLLDPFHVTPGTDVLHGVVDPNSGIPGTAKYLFEVTGFQEPACQAVEFKLAPIEVLWFKYSTMDSHGNLSGINLQTDPPNWLGTEMKPVPNHPGLYQAVIQQPGGTAVNMWLGPGDDEHPQIQYFEGKVEEDGKCILTWVTLNVVELHLLPLEVSIEKEDIAKGHIEVGLSEKKTFQLVAISKRGKPITSTLTVSPKG